MVEGARLESVFRGNSNQGSNPCLSAILLSCFAKALRRINARHEGGLLMYYVYLIESISSKGQRYVGTTANLKQRLSEHNDGKSSHTSKFKPWKLTTYIAFSDRPKAIAFESYLKSGSGHAFANKRLW